MLKNIVENSDFMLMMQKNISNMIGYFFDKNQEFGILCKIEHVSFEPPLPENINMKFHSLTLFAIAGYTFESARIEDNRLVFEAGFGEKNIGSLVSVPLLSIMQIIVDKTPLLINPSPYKEIKTDQKTLDDKGVQNSMNSFLSNPENSKFLKK